MKKISNISQLKAEQQRLKEEAFQLENNIREDWQEIKDSVQPINIARQVVSSALSNSGLGDPKTWLTYLVSFAVTGLAGKLLNKLKTKVTGMFS